MTETLSLRVREIETISPRLKRFVFEAADHCELPAVGPGAHMRLTLQDERQKWKNAYSIAHSSADRSHYAIIVRLEEQSRGGSAFLHERVKTGHIVVAQHPGNLFPMSQIARKHLMISGGIGITPFLSYMDALNNGTTPFELHHFCRIEETAPFKQLLRKFDNAHIHIHMRSTPFDLTEAIISQPLGTHLYTCGPERLMQTVLETSRANGWPEPKLHSESFGSARAGGAPFTAILKRSGTKIEVREDQTLLEAIEEAGFDPTSLCRGGACGQCVTDVLEGEPEHRDHYLDEAERASNRSIMICVSRAKSERIVLDI